MSARGRVVLLGGLEEKRLRPTKNLSEKIFSCLLCEACKGICPLGIDIPETIYQGRKELKSSFNRGRLLRKAIRFSIYRMDTAFMLLKLFQKMPYKSEIIGYLPPVTAKPLKKIQGVFRNRKAIARIGLFLGCSVNYIYPSLGVALIQVLKRRNYEVVILSGEACCGAPLRSIGLEDDAISLARKNIGLFKNMKAEAVLSLCPTCTMVLKTQYPLLTGEGIPNIMDINEFFIKYDILKGLRIKPKTVTYHDPCHLSYGLGITEEPRRIMLDIEGIRLIEMKGSRNCCGFGGLFSRLFRELSTDIGKKKIESIKETGADTVVTSCPGCLMHLDDLKRKAEIDIEIMHIVELVDEAMNE
jgi:glycolate oxidase iron-sulfur subunit